MYQHLVESRFVQVTIAGVRERIQVIVGKLAAYNSDSFIALPPDVIVIVTRCLRQLSVGQDRAKIGSYWLFDILPGLNTGENR
jgi:hypothetical protein